MIHLCFQSDPGRIGFIGSLWWWCWLATMGWFYFKTAGIILHQANLYVSNMSKMFHKSVTTSEPLIDNEPTTLLPSKWVKCTDMSFDLQCYAIFLYIMVMFCSVILYFNKKDYLIIIGYNQIQRTTLHINIAKTLHVWICLVWYQIMSHEPLIAFRVIK